MDLDSASNTKMLNLIEEFKNRPILWQRNHPYFHKTDMKREECVKIALKYNMKASEVKAKIKYLRENYSREKKLINQKDFTGKKNCWRYFEHLRFLDDNPEEYSRKRKTSINAVDMSADDSALSVKRERLTPIANPSETQNFEDSSDSEVLRLSPLSCPSPSVLNRMSEHPESAAILQFIKTSTEVLSKKNSSIAAYLDYLKIKFEEKEISDEKFQEFVDWTTDFVKTL